MLWKEEQKHLSGLKDQLVGYHTKDDPAGYRRSVCDAVFDCVNFLAERKLVSLKTDNLGVTYDDNANIDDIIVKLHKQMRFSAGLYFLSLIYF